MSVTLRAGESHEALVKRWRKQVSKAGILKAARKKRWFVSRSQKRRMAKNKAIRKAKRRKERRASSARGRRRR